MSKSNIPNFEESVLQYMRKQNRPYSVQNVFDNLRGEIPKAKVSLALDVR
jgi:Fe2+ or Zn2+ uptake regulation protein